MNTILYHGSTQIIDKPIFGEGKVWNDYGRAFYCTENIEMAKEWACPELANGFVNKYEINIEGLTILDLLSDEYNILNWLAILVENRRFSLTSDISKIGYKYLLDNFGINYRNYDIIKGYRADDSYFAFANAFLNNSLSLQNLYTAMKLGKLGEQIAIVSKEAFDKLTPLGYEIVDYEVYYLKRINRDNKARREYKELRLAEDFSGTFLADIIRNKWGQDDVCL